MKSEEGEEREEKKKGKQVTGGRRVKGVRETGGENGQITQAGRDGNPRYGR